MDKLRSIQYFMKVAEAGSLAAAAQTLEVDPSAISKAITAFEKALGFALFNRSTRKVSLTAEGAEYLEGCRQILRDLDEAEVRGRQKRGTPAGLVKVAMHSAFRNPFFAAIHAVLNRFPLLQVETRISNSPTVLFDEGFDVLIRAGEVPDSNVIARRIGRLEYVLVASPGYLEQFGEPSSPADLAQHRWVLPARIDHIVGHGPHYEFMRGKERCAITVGSALTLRDGIGFPESIIGGAGIGCPYRIAVTRAIDEGLVKPLLSDWIKPGHATYAVYPNARAITPKTQVVVDLFANLLTRAGKSAPRRK